MQGIVIDGFQYNSIVILPYFFLSFAIMILNYISKGKAVNLFFSTSKRDSLLNPFTYFKLFSHSLGHSDWDHLYNNFIKILLIGPMVEEKYGSINLLIMMLITSGVIGIVHRFTSNGSLRGASGILYMLMLLSSFVNIKSGKIPMTLILIIIFFVVDDIVDFVKKEDDNISHIGHITGSICGIIFGICGINGINFGI